MHLQTYPCGYFLEACEARFAFLVAEHGFGPAQATSHPRECSVAYRRGDDRRIYIHGDVGYIPSVMLMLVNTDVALGFREIMPACHEARWSKRPKPDSGRFSTEQLGPWLDFYRDYLIEHLDTFLGGSITTPLGDDLEGIPDDLRAIVSAVLEQRAAQK